MYYYVYILENEDGKKYIGYTSNLKQRLEYHNRHMGAKTTSSGKWELIYFEGYRTQEQAMRRERSIKGSGSTRKLLYERICVDSSRGSTELKPQ